MSFSSAPKFHEKVTFNPSNVTAGSTMSETILTVSALKAQPGDHVLITAPALESGLEIVTSVIATAGTIPLALKNVTGSDINPASQAFYVTVL